LKLTPEALLPFPGVVVADELAAAPPEVLEGEAELETKPGVVEG